MVSMDLEKNKQLTSLLFVLKLLSVFFSAIPLFQSLFKGVGQNQQFLLNMELILIISLIIFTVLLSFLMVIYYNSQKPNRRTLWLELPLFLLLSIMAIGSSGWNTSYYKFLFIFIIVSCSIEYSMRMGLIVASISSAIVVAIDFICLQNKVVNIYFENDLALISMFFTIAVTVGLYSRIENQHIEYWKQSAYIDGLTDLYNHRYFYQELEERFKQCKEENQPITLIMMDIDYFKNYNDMYGHRQGDEVLREIALLMKRRLKPNFVLCRYGGEEFSVIMPNTTLQDAVKMGEDLRQRIAEFPFEGKEAMPFGQLTVSMGVAERNEESNTFQNLIQQADAALYRAKYLRRNRVEIFASIIDEFHKNNPEMNTTPEAFNTLKTLIAVINSRDSYTYQHIERVVQYCVIVADYLKLKPKDKRDLIYAAYLHDLGKINVEKDVLISSKKLTDVQWAQLKAHPVDGANIIQEVGSMSDIVPIVRQHHERYGGGGYPDGLKGSQICYLARILTLADSFDAMTNDRPYSPKRTYAEAFEEIRRCTGTQFDPALSEQFISAIENATMSRE